MRASKQPGQRGRHLGEQTARQRGRHVGEQTARPTRTSCGRANSQTNADVMNEVPTDRPLNRCACKQACFGDSQARREQVADGVGAPFMGRSVGTSFMTSALACHPPRPCLTASFHPCSPNHLLALPDRSITLLGFLSTSRLPDPFRKPGESQACLLMAIRIRGVFWV